MGRQILSDPGGFTHVIPATIELMSHCIQRKNWWLTSQQNEVSGIIIIRC